MPTMNPREPQHVTPGAERVSARQTTRRAAPKGEGQAERQTKAYSRTRVSRLVCSISPLERASQARQAHSNAREWRGVTFPPLSHAFAAWTLRTPSTSPNVPCDYFRCLNGFRNTREPPPARPTTGNAMEGGFAQLLSFPPTV